MGLQAIRFVLVADYLNPVGMVQLATDVRKKDLQGTSNVFTAIGFRRFPTTPLSRMTTSILVHLV